MSVFSSKFFRGGSYIWENSKIQVKGIGGKRKVVRNKRTAKTPYRRKKR